MRLAWLGRLLTCAMLAYGVAAGLASQLWLFDLLTPFRPQMLAFSLIAVATVAVSRQKTWLLLAMSAPFMNLAPMAWRLVAMPAPHTLSQTSDKPTISLLAANVLSSNTRYQDVINLANTQNTDIVVLTEITPLWASRMAALTARYPYHYSLPRNDNFGLMVFARRPFETQVHTVGNYRLPLLELTFDNMTVLCAHPYPPLGFTGSVENAVYLERLARIVETVDGPVVVAGDMNATLWSSSLRPLLRSNLRRSNALGWAYTWPAGNPLLAIQIDHIFTRDIHSGRFKVLSGDGSDHFPVRADLAI